MVEMIEHAMQAEVTIDYAPAGLHWQVNAPAATVLENAMLKETSAVQ
jgi:hypothetical protein